MTVHNPTLRELFCWKELKEDADQSYGYDMMMERAGYQDEYDNGKRPTYVGTFLRVVWGRAKWYVGSWICERRGHDWDPEIHGYGGPDTGYDAGECRRCGFSFHVTMY